MLHKETVAGTTVGLLRKLEAEDMLSTFCLAGGTALALYLGHRRSVDLDLFTPDPFDVTELREYLEERYRFRTDYSAKNTLKGTIDNIKVDCIRHGYNYLVQPLHIDGLRLYSIEDIIAMKLSAISDNGTRLKDFIDIAFLSTRFSLLSMLDCYVKKFLDTNVLRPVKALTYFEDIDFEENVVMLEGEYNWELIAQRLFEMTQMQGRVFETSPLD